MIIVVKTSRTHLWLLENGIGFTATATAGSVARCVVRLRIVHFISLRMRMCMVRILFHRKPAWSLYLHVVYPLRANNIL